MSWEQALDGWEAWCRAGGLAPRTVQIRRHYLGRFATVHPDPWQVQAVDLVGFVGTPGWGTETRRSARGALRSFYGWAQQAGHVERDPSATLPPVRMPAGVPRPTPDDVFTTALDQADQRTRLVLLLGAYAGLRAGEIAGLSWADVDDWSRLHVVGKGARARSVPLHPVLAAELRAEHARRVTGRMGSGWRYGAARGLVWVFPGRSEGSYKPDHVSRVAQRALPGHSTHSLRHRFATRAYAAERDLLAVQDLLGHSKPETTRRYVQTPAGALERAVLAAG